MQVEAVRAIVYNEMNTRPAPTIVYIYGRPGCGKTRLLHEVFAANDGIVYKGNVRISIWDDAGYHSFTNLAKMPECDYFVISGNIQPDYIPIHMDHIFCLDSAEALKECRAFLNSIYGE